MSSGVKRVLLATAICALASPAVAAASNVYMSFGPVKMGQGYALSGTAGTPGPGQEPGLTLTVSKTGGGQTESYAYEYSKKVAVKANGGLSSGTLKVAMGSYGTLSLKFAATGALKHIKDPDGCTGPKFQSRAGKVSGTLAFNTHTALGSVTAHSAKASLAKFSAGKENCGATGDLYMLTMGGGGTLTGNLLSATKSSPGTSVRAGYNQFASGSFPFNLFATISQDNGFSVQPMSSARVSVSGPFMSGMSSFAETSQCETTADYVYGSISGTITARFDVGGTQTYGADGEATLVKNFAQCAVGCSTSCGTGGTGGTGGNPGNGPLVVEPACGQDDPTVTTIGCSDNSSGGTQPYTESWDWGDGSPPDSGATPTHTYAAPGTYTVTETVTDATGAKQSGTTQITVTSS